MDIPRSAPAECAGVELLRLDTNGARTEHVRAQAAGLRVAPGQRRFAAPVSATLPLADATPSQVPFAVLRDGGCAGFGVLDRAVPGGAGILPGPSGGVTPDPGTVVMLRSFLIDLEWQGEGLARRACLLLAPLARAAAPHARDLLLTVNEANPAALRAYTAGGFTDTGRRYLAGPAGPQRVMSTALV